MILSTSSFRVRLKCRASTIVRNMPRTSAGFSSGRDCTSEVRWQIHFRHVDVDLQPGFFSLDFSGPVTTVKSNWRVLTAAIRGEEPPTMTVFRSLIQVGVLSPRRNGNRPRSRRCTADHTRACNFGLAFFCRCRLIGYLLSAPRAAPHLKLCRKEGSGNELFCHGTGTHRDLDGAV